MHTNGKVTMTKRFYVGSQSIANSSNNPKLKTLHEAVAEGIERIQENGEDVVNIVEVVRIIRRKPPIKPEVIIEETR